MKKKSVIIAIVIVLVGLIAWIVAFKTKGKTSEKDTVKIGVILPLTGDGAVYGEDAALGIRFAVKELYGENATLRIKDSKAEPKTAVNVYNELKRENVDFVVGDLFSNTTLAISPIANRNKNLLVSPTASSQELPKNGIYSLSVYPSEAFESELVASFVGNKYSTTAILYEKVAAAQLMCDAYREKCKIEVGIVEGFDSETLDYTNMLQKIKDKGIESVYLVTYSNNAKTILKQISDMGMEVDVIGISSLFDPSLCPYLDNIKGRFYLTGPSFDVSGDDESMKSFVESFVNEYNKQPNQMAFQGYIAVNVAKDLFEQIQTGTYSKDFLKSYSRPILGKTFNFSDQLTSELGLSLYEYRDGGFMIIPEE